MSLLEEKLRQHPTPYLVEGDLEYLLPGTEDSRVGKVNRLVAQGKLLRIKRGLYCITEKVGYPTKPHPFCLAQYIYGPSYISLESALSYHQLIPEAVYTTTSVCTKRSKEFQTPLGVFSFNHLPSINFFTEVELIKENSYQFFMAKPWKAICDYIFCYKKDWDSLDPLVNSLRIDIEDLPMLQEEPIHDLEDYYRHKRVTRFLRKIKKELNL